MTTKRWKVRPPGSNWGDFGPDDQLGRLNLLTTEQVLKGIAEVREGRTFCLSFPLDYPGGNAMNAYRFPPRLRPSEEQGSPNMNRPERLKYPGVTDVFSDDIVELNLQYSTHWDSLAHAGQLFDVDDDGVPEIVYYNGYRAGEHVVGPFDYISGKSFADAKSGARALGIENVAAACIQGRGVMIDFEAHYGREHRLIGYDELAAILEKDNVVIEEGDLVCIRTGTAKMIYEMKGEPNADVIRHSCAKLDGRDERILKWVTDTGLVALICDNNAVEASPSRPCTHDSCARLPLHEHCLFKLGVHLAELWDLGELADWLRANGRSRFLLTAPPLRLPGAVGSPVTPIATV